MSGTNSNRKLHLNRQKAIIGGVCAGYADYFGIDAFFIRLGFVIAAFTWPLSILVYVISYFCMDDKKTSLGEVCNNITNSRIGQHFKNVDYKKRLYKSRSNKKICGVCAGIGDYLEINPFFIRLAVVLSLFFGPFGIVAYFVASMIMDVDPDEADLGPNSRRSRRRESHRERRRQRRQRRYTQDVGRNISESISRSVSKSRSRNNDYMEDDSYEEYEEESFTEPPPRFDKRELKQTTEKFSELEKKLRRLEATITSKKFKLHSELNRMSN